MNAFLLKYKIIFWGAIIITFCHPMRSLGESFHTINDAAPLYGYRINDLLEDKEGYLWIGTNKGLFRYDGQQMFNTTNVLNPSLRMSDNLWVSSIQEDASRHLWVARGYTSNYILLNAQRKVIDTNQYLISLGISKQKVFQILIDKQGDLWEITQDSLFHYCYRDRTLRAFELTNRFDLDHRPLSVCGSHGVLYIIDVNTLYTFFEQNTTWSVEELPFILPELGKTKFLMTSRGYIDAKEDLWITSFFSEDIFYRPHDEKEWRHILLPSHNDTKRSKDGRYYNSIRHWAEDANGGIWIASEHRGLFYYTPSSDTWKQFLHNPDDDKSIASNNVLKVLVDRHGTLWVGYYNYGMSYHHSNLDKVKRQIVPNGDVTALLTDVEGVRWIGTEGHGLWKQESSGRISQMPDIPDITITDLQQDPNGYIWVATYDQGLYKVDSKSSKTHHFTASGGMLPHDGSSRIAIDGEGNLWVCSTIGTLYRFNPQNYRFQTYDYPSSGNDINGEAIAYDPKGNRILIGSYQNVCVHDIARDSTFVWTGARGGNQPLKDPHVSNLWVSSHSNLIWMSHGIGLSVWDTQADSLYFLDSTDYGLLPGNIQSICEDSTHRLWVAGTTTIAVIQPQRETDGRLVFHIRSLPVEMQSAVKLYMLHSVTSEPRGTMLFGNTTGYTEFVGQSLLANTSEPDRPNFSTLYLGDSIISLSPLASDKSSLGHDQTAQALVLTHDHQPLTVHFFSGNLLGTSGANYTYRVKGLYHPKDKLEGWIDTPSTFLTFHSLPPGEYTLELRVMGSEGVWSPISSMPIIVQHPWWDTLPMRFVYGLAAILIVALAVYLTRRQQIKRLAREREEWIREHESRITQLTITPLDEQFLQRTIEIVDGHLADANFNVEALAAEANMSRSLLYKRLMALTGQSPIEYIRRLRMKRAAFLLQSSKLQVTEIAYQVGYNTIKTFTDNFKQVYGMTPTDYRKKNKIN